MSLSQILSIGIGVPVGLVVVALIAYGIYKRCSNGTSATRLPLQPREQTSITFGGLTINPLVPTSLMPTGQSTTTTSITGFQGIGSLEPQLPPRSGNRIMYDILLAFAERQFPNKPDYGTYYSDDEDQPPHTTPLHKFDGGIFCYLRTRPNGAPTFENLGDHFLRFLRIFDWVEPKIIVSFDQGLSVFPSQPVYYGSQVFIHPISGTQTKTDVERRLVEYIAYFLKHPEPSIRSDFSQFIQGNQDCLEFAKFKGYSDLHGLITWLNEIPV
jgi:hypothetical protein